MLRLFMAVGLLMLLSGTANAQDDDPYLWLEDVQGDKALGWVKERNAETAKALEADPAFKKLEAAILEVMDSKDKIPSVSKEGTWYYNFWQDAKNPRGLWRRTTLEEYKKPKPKWETVLDVDALGAAEKENWVFKGAEILKPDRSRVLVSLSRGGADAIVTREFDLATKTFVKGGFELPEAKAGVGWIDRDTVFVSTDFGPGTMSAAGYPRIAKRWKRGTPLSAATTVFEAKESELSAYAYHDTTPGYERDFVIDYMTIYTHQTFLLGADGKLKKIETPDDADASVYRDWLLVRPRTPWEVAGTTHPAGSLLAFRFQAFLAGGREAEVLFSPTATRSLETYSWTRRHLIVNVLDDVKNKLELLTPPEGKGTGGWKRAPLAGAPALGSVSAWGIDPDESDEIFMKVTDYLTPTTLSYGLAGSAPEPVKRTPAFFDASKLSISQHFATSEDGTRVPYFQVAPKGMKLDGSNPTLLSGYGGFEVSELPAYSGTVGRAWLEKGGVYVVANIRGGGEYGPAWHQAALKANRGRSFADFAAVASDLAARKVASPKHIGIVGGSNGGLLVGNMITKYPGVFGAAVCQVPLLDMKRYSKLLAGASWMDEYGDPDKPEEWAYLRGYSPYHNIDAAKTYPPVLFTTSTRDDRVHPGHARKMAARMLAMDKNVLYYENIEGGHAGAADHKQAAHMWALTFAFLDRELRLEELKVANPELKIKP